MADWTYSVARRRYRDPTSGRFISPREVQRQYEQFTAARASIMAQLAGGLANGTLDVPGWESKMREQIKLAHGAAYALGRGGVHVMGPDDWNAIDAHVRDQMRYLTRFSRDVADGKLSERQVAARSQLYAHSSRQVFERGRAAAFDIRLPVYPADGGTACKMRCHCHWEIRIESIRAVSRGQRIVASWRLGAAEHCPDCIARAITYRAYTVTIGNMQRGEAA